MIEYKKIMTSQASIIPEYNNKTVQQLADEYLLTEDLQLRDGYIAALTLKYWSKIYTYYNKSRTLKIELEDVYEWVLECILVTLQLHPWDNPEDKLYEDPNGFDKVFNRCLACARVNAYQFSNRKKRKEGHFVSSLNEIEETIGDSYVSPELIDSLSMVESQEKIEIHDLMKKLFDLKDYIKCFILFAIVDYRADTPEKIRKFLMGNDKHIVELSTLYKIPLVKVAKAASYLNNLNYSNVINKINKHLNELGQIINA